MDKKYNGPYPVIKTKDSTVYVQDGDNTKRYHCQHVKPYFSTFTLIALFFIITSACASVVQPIKNTSGILFQNIGTVLNHVDEWKIITTFNTGIVWKKSLHFAQYQYRSATGH